MRDEASTTVSAPAKRRPLGTMIVYGFPRGALAGELELAAALRADCLEILPDWGSYPDPADLVAQAADAGLRIHSVHGSWGGRTVKAERVDLAHPSEITRSGSLDDVRRCLDWATACGASVLVVHPGGLSDLDEQTLRRGLLIDSLAALADACTGSAVTICVENMPPGVHPGQQMADLYELVATLDRAEVALALDTGHANLNAGVVVETQAAGALLKTTHVHDNNGRSDTHLPPGHGTIDWEAWGVELDRVGYEGVVMLECIRQLRLHPELIDEALLERLDRLRGVQRS